MHGLIVLIHVAAMLGLFSTLALGGLALRSLCRAVDLVIVAIAGGVSEVNQLLTLRNT